MVTSTYLHDAFSTACEIEIKTILFVILCLCAVYIDYSFDENAVAVVESG